MKLATQQKVQDLSQHPGEWVALVEGKVIAHNDTLKDLMAQVERLGAADKASVLLVPRKDEGPYVLIVV